MKYSKKILSFVVVFVLTISLSIPTSAAISLSKKSITLNIGKTYTINLKGTSKKAKWSISNSKLKKVSSTKKSIKIKAIKSGTSYVKCKVNGKTYKCKIVVKSSSTKSSSSYVYISATGTKYHRTSGCGNMKGGTKMTKSAASSAGYDACKKCY